MAGSGLGLAHVADDLFSQLVSAWPKLPKAITMDG